MSLHQQATTSSYRPEIDGLRTVAVMLVVAFHSGLAGFDGGFIGVDMFFVLSGYLITGLLVREATSGRINLRRFYARRSRRLLPASLVAIVAISTAWWLTASFVARRPLIGDARAASLYMSNWHFAAQATDYFAIGNQPSPFLHFWSLAVEEQFYVVWPAVVVLCGVYARRTARTSLVVALRIVGAVAALVSVVSVLVTTARGNDSLAYFATHNRVYQLLGGALLGTLAIRQWRNVAAHATQVCSLALLLALGSSALHLTPTWRGLITAVCTVALLWSITAHPNTAVMRLLSSRFVVWLGTLSYAIYLWHWPIILLAQRFVTQRAPLVFVGTVAVSVGIAAASTRLFEAPIRQSVRLSNHHVQVVVAGLVLSTVVGLAVAPRLLQSTRRPIVHAPVADSPHTTAPTTLVPAPTETLPSAATIASVVRDGPPLPCLERRGPVCLVHRGGVGTMLVIGDSHLHALVNGLADIAQHRDMNLWVFLQHLCPWEADLIEAGPLKASCRASKQQLYGAVLPAIHPDVVFAVNRGYDDSAMPTKFLGAGGGTVNPADALASGVAPAVDTVLRSSQRLIVLEPWPTMPFIQRDCLAAARVVTDCAGTADWPLRSTTAIENLARSNARLTQITLNDLICPRLPTCDAVVSGLIVRVDRNHLNYRFGETLTSALETRLAEAGAFTAATP